MKKKRKREKLAKKTKKEKTLWITVVIHSNLGMGEQWFPPHHLDIVNICCFDIYRWSRKFR